MPNDQRKYDLEDRTAKFGEAIIKFAKKIPFTQVTKSLVDQLVRAGTAVGANYCEADSAHSKKDFNHKIAICKKESRETRHWLRMMAEAAPEFKSEARILWKEANELSLIFSAIIRNQKIRV